MSQVAVTGASGQFGRRAVELLLEAGIKPIAITRTPDAAKELAERGAEVRFGDFYDSASLDHAFAGADRILMVAANEVHDARVRRHRAAVDAAVRAGCEYLVYTSAIRAGVGPDPIENDHAVTEQYLSSLSMPYTALRENLRIDWVFRLLPQAVVDGVLRVPGGDGGIGLIWRDDAVRCAVSLLRQPRRSAGFVELTGPELVGYGDLAEIVSEVTGVAVAYDAETPEQARARLAAAGVERIVAEIELSESFATARGAFAKVTDTVEELTGEPARGVREYLAGKREALLAGRP
jgi:NAD(P)H dehydrogenase (quinone)